MNYNDFSTNEQRLQIAAYGYQQVVRPDSTIMREANKMRDIAAKAFRSYDPAKSALRFAVFLKAVKMARLEPPHILEWLSRSYYGEHEIKEFAKREYGLIERTSRRAAA